MRKTVVPRNTAGTRTRPARRRGAGVPEVPTFQPEREAVPAGTAPPVGAADEGAEDAVRRMVEAAYT